jgi:hypothetical protein
MSEKKLTYRIEEAEDGLRKITCLICGMTSYNQNDVEQKYCGSCHQFHNIMMAMQELGIQEE